jgi:hypothetical protein
MLQVGGNKFDLVLRVLQHDHETGGESLKRAATETAVVLDKTTGEEKEIQVNKKRKTGTAKPKASTFHAQVQRKIHAASQKKYKSYWGAKHHGPDVSSLMDDLYDQAKSLVQSNPHLAYKLITAIFTAFVDNFSSMHRPEYLEGLSDMAGSLHCDFTRLKPHLSASQCEQATEWLEKFEDVCS